MVLPSLSPLAAAVVSVESQLSCSVASVGPTGITAVPAAGVLLLEAGWPVLPADSVSISDSEGVFVHWRAFFYKMCEQYRVSRPVVIWRNVCVTHIRKFIFLSFDFVVMNQIHCYTAALKKYCDCACFSL